MRAQNDWKSGFTHPAHNRAYLRVPIGASPGKFRQATRQKSHLAGIAGGNDQLSVAAREDELPISSS